MVLPAAQGVVDLDAAQFGGVLVDVELQRLLGRADDAEDGAQQEHADAVKEVVTIGARRLLAERHDGPGVADDIAGPIDQPHARVADLAAVDDVFEGVGVERPFMGHGAGNEPGLIRHPARLRRLQPPFVLTQKQHARHGHKDQQEVERQKADGKPGKGA
jgi:hypothetical protein